MTFKPGKKSPDYKALYDADKRKNLAALSPRYDALPANFRRTLAEAARIKEDRRGLDLVDLTEEERKALLAACQRLKDNVLKAWPLLIRACPTRLPL